VSRNTARNATKQFKTMQIVIPMSGFGERFRRAGYQVPKPLIEVDGKPIIAHVVDLFPDESRFVFICNREHLDNDAFGMRKILEDICPTGQIVGIDPHKLGPVYAVSQAYDALDPDEPTIVNYCDFTCFWDYADFKSFVEETGCDGAIPSYRGFHPHSLGSTFYAYVRERDGWVLDIQEKQPFTDQPMNEFASSGTYYFASGRMAREYFDRTMAEQLTVSGEYYVSLVYKPMLDDGKSVAVYDLQHFMQWGTPGDLEEYNAWSEAFRILCDKRRRQPAAHDGTILLPMAGLGSRFANEGYATPKPLIPVSGRPMVLQATGDLPAAPRHVFVVRRDMPGRSETEKQIKDNYADVDIVELSAPTDGQARTCMLGFDDDRIDLDQPVTIGACDNGALYDTAAFAHLMADGDTDVIVWGKRGYPGAVRNPQMYGWIDTDGGLVAGVSVKTPLSAPETDPIVVGTFTFKRGRDFLAAAERMIEREARINGEYYVDTCINDAIALGLKCRILEIDSYLCWGTPNDLKTFEYWQSCFHKWPGHPYRLQDDRRVPADAIESLEQRYAARRPARPGIRP
jgi:NDP-sugar pyrophosphorylase family protein